MSLNVNEVRLLDTKRPTRACAKNLESTKIPLYSSLAGALGTTRANVLTLELRQVWIERGNVNYHLAKCKSISDIPRGSDIARSHNDS